MTTYNHIALTLCADLGSLGDLTASQRTDYYRAVESAVRAEYPGITIEMRDPVGREGHGNVIGTGNGWAEIDVLAIANRVWENA